MDTDERDCVNMLILCGEEGGKRSDERPRDYLRRLIDALIRAQAKLEALDKHAHRHAMY